MTEIYRHTAEYAREHGELSSYRASMQENKACKEAIEAVISKNFDGFHLPADTAQTVVKQFGHERVQFVLANTVQVKDWNGRFSRRNKEWANGFDIPGDRQKGGEHRFVFAVNSHPTVLNGFIDMVRGMERERQRPSVMDALKTVQPERGKAARAPRHEAVR